jgi:hypothetical protein
MQHWPGHIASLSTGHFYFIFKQDIWLKPVTLGISTENLLQSFNVNIKFPKETKKHN